MFSLSGLLARFLVGRQRSCRLRNGAGGERQRSSRASLVRLAKWCARRRPVAALLLFVAYAQALTGFLPLGGRDPLARLLGVGFKPVADSLVSAARAQADRRGPHHRL